MKLNLIKSFVFIILESILLIIIFDYPKKIISRLIFSHDLSLLTYSVFEKINEKQSFDMTEKKNNKKSLIVLNRFVYDFFRPEFDNLDDGVSWKMLHGSIKCDGVSDILLRLAEYTNARAMMVFLYNNKNISPHTLVLIDINEILNLDDKVNLSHKINKPEENYNLNNIFLFDPTFNYYPLNKKNEYVNINYMLDNFDQFQSYSMLDSDDIKLNLLKNKKLIFMTNRKYNEYSIINKISLNLSKLLPEKILNLTFKFGIFINPNLNQDYKDFLYARLEHVLLNYDLAKKNYQNIEIESNYYDQSQYWLKRILNSDSKLKNYEQILDINRN